MNAPTRLLIADDDPVMRMLLGAIADGDPEIELVAAAEDAEQAIALAKEHQPDVALLDVEMPGGGGAHAAREIRGALPATRILALSAHERSEEMERLVDGYVVKGAAPREVAAAIKR
jgi:DNA-binding NarL/FixJ family response regulator